MLVAPGSQITIREFSAMYLHTSMLVLATVVPTHIYLLSQAFPFDPNPDWTRFYASGSDILAYIKRTVEKWNLDRDLHLNTKVVAAHWQKDAGEWKVTVENQGQHRDEFCDVLISAQGVLV